MSFDFTGLPTAIWPTPTTPVNKDVICKAVKLVGTDFTTGGAASVKLYVPADASIIGFRLWTKTTFAGNGVTALSLQIGVTGTVAKYVAASTVALTGPSTIVFPTGALSNIFQTYDPTVPTGDIPLLFTGTATTGNPTSGEAYVLVEYIR